MAGGDEGLDHPDASVLLDRPFDLGTLSAARRALQGSFPSDELNEKRAQGFVAAINEGMINAIQHGGGRGNVRLVRTDGRLIAVVEDIRPSNPFVLTQNLPPPTAEGGRGLWIIARCCDAARVESGRTGLRLVMELALRRK
jgi:serine/threonine-protein kinase RsbW